VCVCAWTNKWSCTHTYICVCVQLYKCTTHSFELLRRQTLRSIYYYFYYYIILRAFTDRIFTRVLPHEFVQASSHIYMLFRTAYLGHGPQGFHLDLEPYYSVKVILFHIILETLFFILQKWPRHFSSGNGLVSYIILWNE